jgi:hypothetical protein
MEDNIVRKIRSHLASPIDTEAAVVYLLSETRKLIDRDRSKQGLFALLMFCHWALHVTLTKPGTTKAFLERVDKFILRNISGYQDDGTFTLVDEQALFREFVYLDTFRQELKRFLGSYGLPTGICDDNKQWSTFLSAYASVIEEGELTITGNSNSLVAVQKVVFRKGGDTRLADSHVSFVIRWNIHLRDGRICETQFEANSTQKMIAFNLHLIQSPIQNQILLDATEVE